MAEYGGQSIDCCYKFATDTRRTLVQLRISGKSRRILNGIEQQDYHGCRRDSLSALNVNAM